MEPRSRSRGQANAASPIPHSWLGALNYFRSQAGLPPVEAKRGLSKGAKKHSRYMIENQRFTHFEKPNLPFYTRAGDRAGQNGNLVASHFRLSDGEAVGAWMPMPFHAIGMIDPALRRSGFGSYFEKNGPAKFDYGATLNVSSGLGAVPNSVQYPVMYPKDGATTYVRAYPGAEVPDPLVGCGFNAPTGAPIYLLQKKNFGLTDHSLELNGQPVKHCAYDHREFPGAGKRSLKAHKAIVVIPKKPLASEAEYEVSITTEARETSWTFTTADFIPPTTTITHPQDEEGKTPDGYESHEIETITGTASGDAVKVEIALLELKNGNCRWWDGSEFVARGCGKYLWVETDGTQDWTYTLSSPLTSATDFYFLYSRATDEAGNQETPKSDDDSEVVFYISD